MAFAIGLSLVIALFERPQRSMLLTLEPGWLGGTVHNRRSRRGVIKVLFPQASLRWG
jgi:hypothetical protein